MPFSTTRNLPGRTYDCPDANDDNAVPSVGCAITSGHRRDQGREADRTYADAHRALIIRMG